MKKYLAKNVYEAALERINFVFDDFDKVCVSFSGGKDSTVLLHLTLQVARERNRLPIYAMFLDLEGQYRSTIQHIEEMIETPDVVPFWICLPINLRNAVSVFDPHWCCWDPDKRDMWVRGIPSHPCVISDPSYFPFFKYRMEFEDFVPLFGDWLASDQQLAVLVGIRADESLNRYRAIVKDRASRHKGMGWTFRRTMNTVNCYPIYDWRTEDIWTFIGKNDLAYNKLYDHMYLAGKSIHEMRICQPYGDDQRKGLNQFHKIEPDTWHRIVQRVSGANFGNLYCGQKMLGYNRGLGLPPGHTWKSYTKLLLKTLPEKSRLHYRRKFAVFIWWWRVRGGVRFIPDTSNREMEAGKKAPSWRRLAMCILKNDFWCKSLSFAMTKDLYTKYYQPIEKRAQRPGDSLLAIKEKYRSL